MTLRPLILAAAAAVALTIAPPSLAAAAGGGGAASASAEAARFERDRQSILAMAGEYKVRFDFRETVPFLADYQPIAPKVSGGHEAVRVIEDDGRAIRLQHLLVVDGGEGPIVIKHWRQDWVYEPTTVLVYEKAGRWVSKPVPAARRKGAWSQTVWQTDDSPRYGGVGRWVYDDGATRWTSDESLRPLARRDAVRHPPYDHYVGINRHALTPTGWVHEQDNAKIGVRDGAGVTFVHEVVLNTYTRDSDFAVAAADEYWTKTKDYWAAVRAAWDQASSRDGAVTVQEEAENGSVTGPELMGLADDLAAGKVAQTDAIKRAERLISATEAPPKAQAAARPNAG